MELIASISSLFFMRIARSSALSGVVLVASVIISLGLTPFMYFSIELPVSCSDSATWKPFSIDFDDFDLMDQKKSSTFALDQLKSVSEFEHIGQKKQVQSQVSTHHERM